jgi:hypothetical protein
MGKPQESEYHQGTTLSLLVVPVYVTITGAEPTEEC